MTNLQELSDAIVAGRLELAVELTRAALEEGVDPQSIISDYMIPAMQCIGQQFQEGKAYVPELLMAARAMKGALELIKPLLTSGKSATLGKIVIGTVYGDLHDIGKNLVRMMMESKGLNVIDLGNSVPPAKYIEAAKKHHADIIACSALLTTTMVHIKDVVAAVAADPELAGKVKIMIGGAPVNDAFRESIGADIYTPDASTAAEKAVEVCAAMHA